MATTKLTRVRTKVPFGKVPDIIIKNMSPETYEQLVNVKTKTREYLYDIALIAVEEGIKTAQFKKRVGL